MKKILSPNLRSIRFLLITHTFATGPPQELRDFFIKNDISFSFLEHPFSYNHQDKHSKVTLFESGKKVKTIMGPNYGGGDLLHFLLDFLLTFYFVIRSHKRYDVCIAADNLNAAASVFLKKLGFIRNLIYWTIDYTPNRFGNALLNAVFYNLDTFSCTQSDLLWNSSKRMNPARAKRGVAISNCAPEVIVPDGCHFEEIKRLDSSAVNRFKLVFMGHLVKNKGVDLLITALPDLLQMFPQVSLTIIGTGPEESNLKRVASSLNLDDKVFFTGYIKNHKQLEQTIAGCGVGLSPYVPDPNSYTFFSDVGKVKVYLACGLPVLITEVPEIATEIQNNGAGLIFKYDVQSFMAKVKLLIEDEVRYMEYRRNALYFVENLSWNNVFNEVLNQSIVHFKT
ncbi:MAG: glycosyltransferase [Nitrososphaerota archaeon]|jgi:glycosyltransferase involved in cell wall biosynthesis|nr:glycosyltransferase [Nitrososphaerota archaeon]